MTTSPATLHRRRARRRRGGRQAGSATPPSWDSWRSTSRSDGAGKGLRGPLGGCRGCVCAVPWRVKMPLERRSAEREAALVLESSDGDVASFSFTITSSITITSVLLRSPRSKAVHSDLFRHTSHRATANRPARRPRPPREFPPAPADALSQQIVGSKHPNLIAKELHTHWRPSSFRKLYTHRAPRF